MERSEPVLVPEWYKTGGFGSNSNSNSHHPSTSNSDKLGIIRSSRNKVLPNTSDHGSFRTIFSKDRDSDSSYRRSKSMNGYTSFDKDNSTYSSAYRNFNNRGHRDRNREKNFDYCDKKSSILDNGYSDYLDIHSKGKSEKDIFLWSQSKLPGRLSESQPKASLNESNNVFPHNLVNGIQKSLFEREFPSLGSEVKVEHPEIGRALPSALNSVSQVSVCNSVSIGSEGWTSALAAVPSGIESSLSKTSKQATHSHSVSIAPSTNPTLNMAETIVKATTHSRGSPKGFNSLESQVLKRIKTWNMAVLPKVMPQSPSQPMNNLHRGTSQSDGLKTRQGWNFQVLNQESSNSSIPDGNKIASPRHASNSSISTVSKRAASSKPMIKSDMIQNTFVGKRHLGKDRVSFFNTLRKSSSAKHSSSPNQENCVNFSPVSEKPLDQTVVLSNTENFDKSEDYTSCPDCSNEDDFEIGRAHV